MTPGKGYEIVKVQHGQQYDGRAMMPTVRLSLAHEGVILKDVELRFIHSQDGAEILTEIVS